MKVTVQPSYGLKINTSYEEIKPLISFIVPTSLSRPSLFSTIQSILAQTKNEWETLVGIDTKSMENASNFVPIEETVKDSRIKVINVNSSTSDRGDCGNGAGGIRNVLIKNYSRSQWVGFVDDDDAIDSCYVKFLLEALSFDKNVDLVIFTMRLTSGYLIPTRRHFQKHYILKNYVGISFAVRKSLFLTEPRPLEFKASCTEDYDLLRDAFTMGYNLMLSDCVAYQVKPLQMNKSLCQELQCDFHKLKKVYDLPPKKVKKK
jgi:glycosyltransferase involved in cell wall biosynthesis